MAVEAAASSAKPMPSARTSPPISRPARFGLVRSSQAATSSERGRADRCVVERRAVALEHDPLPARVAQHDLAPCLGALAQRDRKIGPFGGGGFERDHLAEPASSEVDVAARLEGEAVERSLEREAPPVHRGRHRDDGLLESCRRVRYSLSRRSSSPSVVLTRPRGSRRSGRPSPWRLPRSRRCRHRRAPCSP